MIVTAFVLLQSTVHALLRFITRRLHFCRYSVIHLPLTPPLPWLPQTGRMTLLL
jgi:hypothetical protein